MVQVLWHFYFSDSEAFLNLDTPPEVHKLKIGCTWYFTIIAGLDQEDDPKFIIFMPNMFLSQ